MKNEDCLKEVIDFKRGMIKELLEKCTEQQVKVFNLMYRCSVDEIPKNRLDWAICQCKRTVSENEMIVNKAEEIRVKKLEQENASLKSKIDVARKALLDIRKYSFMEHVYTAEEALKKIGER